MKIHTSVELWGKNVNNKSNTEMKQSCQFSSLLTLHFDEKFTNSRMNFSNMMRLISIVCSARIWLDKVTYLADRLGNRKGVPKSEGLIVIYDHKHVLCNKSYSQWPSLYLCWSVQRVKQKLCSWCKMKHTGLMYFKTMSFLEIQSFWPLNYQICSQFNWMCTHLA